MSPKQLLSRAVTEGYNISTRQALNFYAMGQDIKPEHFMMELHCLTDWLREQRNLCVEVCVTVPATGRQYLFRVVESGSGFYNKVVETKSTYAEYSKALEDAIIFCLLRLAG